MLHKLSGALVGGVLGGLLAAALSAVLCVLGFLLAVLAIPDASPLRPVSEAVWNAGPVLLGLLFLGGVGGLSLLGFIKGVGIFTRRNLG